MNPVRQVFHDAFDTLYSKRAGRIAGYKLRPLTIWHLSMLHRLDGELKESDKVSSLWLIIQVLRWPPLSRMWRIRLALAEPGFLNIRTFIAVKRIFRDLDGTEKRLEKYWAIWFPKPHTKGEESTADESGQQTKKKSKGINMPWFLLVVTELMSLGFSHEDAWKMNPGYALHLLWCNREREGSETPLIDEETAAALEEIGAW